MSLETLVLRANVAVVAEPVVPDHDGNRVVLDAGRGGTGEDIGPVFFTGEVDVSQLIYY